jgi:hypothetical protein
MVKAQRKVGAKDGRMSRKTNCVVMLLLVLSGEWAVWASQGSEEERPVSVSLISVIANPEKFDGRRLRVIGVLSYGGGLDRSVCLYVSEPDARNGVMPNCIYVDQSVDRSDKRLGKYVILNATFHYVSGHGLEYLSFKQISDMKLWTSPPDK